MKKKIQAHKRNSSLDTNFLIFVNVFLYKYIYNILLAREYYLASSTISLPRKNNNISFSTHTHISTYILHTIYICIFLYLLKVDTY